MYIVNSVNKFLHYFCRARYVIRVPQIGHQLSSDLDPPSKPSSARRITTSHLHRTLFVHDVEQVWEGALYYTTYSCHLPFGHLTFDYHTLCSKKSDAKIQIITTTSNLIRIKHPLSSFNYCLSGAKVANFNKIHRTVYEQQPFKKWNSKT